MDLEQKNQILLKTIERLEKENASLKQQCEDMPKIKQLADELISAQTEFNRLNKELKDEIKEYKEINRDFLVLKNKLIK
jgi:predicted RNase H-like nuclease (RuvC/YqgF family)